MKRRPDPLLNYVLCLVLVIGFVLISYGSGEGMLPVYTPATPLQTAEVRGVWLSTHQSLVLFKLGSLNHALARLARHQFNRVYPSIWGKGHSFYPSGVATKIIGQEQYPGLNLWRWGSNALLAAVTEGHRQGLKVMPWLEDGLIIPADSSLARKHPDWLLKDRQGVRSIGKLGERFLVSPPQMAIAHWFQRDQQQQQQNQVWFNPLQPQVQALIKGVILEAVRDYDVDGIQLGDRLGFPVTFGYDTFTASLYAKEHNNQPPPDDPYNSEWMAWRAGKLTDWVQDVSRSIKTIKPRIKLSLSPLPPDLAYREYLQNWQVWVEDGLIDELILPVYETEAERFQSQLDDPKLQPLSQKVPISISLLAGTWDRPVDSQTILQQVQAVRDRRFAGLAFYYWESLWGYLTPDPPQRRRELFQSLFADAKPSNRS